MLSPFAIRYTVRTTSNERPLKERIWLVGLNAVRTVDNEIAEDSEA
jgi:hypothetical protein